MELPEICLTNVFKIDNLSEISYSIYRISSTLGSAPAWRILSKAETNLRRLGKCVTTCPESSELWLFQLDSNENDAALASDSGYNSYDGSGSSEKEWEPLVWGLEEKTKDVLHIHELFDILKPSPTEKPDELMPLQTLSPLDATMLPGTRVDPIDLSGTHRDVFMLQQLSKQRASQMSTAAIGSPATGSKPGSSTTSTPRVITTKSISKQEIIAQKCLLALMSLLSYRLASSFSWIPLNLYTFLHKTPSGKVLGERVHDTAPNFPIESVFQDESDILSNPPMPSSPSLLTSIFLSLLDDGSLHITPKTISQCALQRFCDAKISDIIEEDVWLAPSGIVGRYTAKSASDGIVQATSEWKAFVLKSLSDRGVGLENPGSMTWAKINVWSDIEGMVEIYWPTLFIFVRKYPGKEPLLNITPSAPNQALRPKANSDTEAMGNLVRQLTWYTVGDSLEFAGSWLSEASSRETEKKRRLEIRSKVIPLGDLEKKANFIAPTTDRSGTVYPTPPDGISGNDSHPTPGILPTAPTPGQLKVVEDAVTAAVEPPTAPPTAEATVNSTEMDLDDAWMKDSETSKTGDDMFGGGQDVGMEDDLFDITEDDFGFFDKIGNNGFAEITLEKPESSSEIPPRPSTSALSENMNELNIGFSALGSYAEDKLALVDMDLDLDDIGAAMDMQAEMQSNEDGPSHPVPSHSLDGSLSQQGQRISRINAPSEDLQNDIVQVETPPLSPQKAMKLLLLDPGSPDGSLITETKGRNLPNLSRRKSLYSPVDFPSFMGRSDEKYMAGGRFFCADDDSKPRGKSLETRKFSATFPRIKKYRNTGRPLSRDIMFLEDEEERGDLIPDIGSSEEDTTTTDEYDSGDEEMFEISNEGGADTSSYSTSLSPEGTRQGLKRKRNVTEQDYWGSNKVQGVEAHVNADKQNDLDSAPEWSTDIATLNDKDIDNLSAALRALCDFNPGNLSLDGVFSFVPDNDDISIRIPPHDFTHIIGLLQEQVVWNTYLISEFSPGNPSCGRISSVEVDANGIHEPAERSFNLKQKSIRYQDDLEELLTETFGALVSRCSLETLVYGVLGRPKNSIYGVSPGTLDAAGHLTSFVPMNRPKSSSDAIGPSLLFRIGAPHIHVHRNATLPNGAIESLPPALHFWDTFGLAPHSGPKDMLMACVFPTESGLNNSARAYLDALSTTYESCRLGETLPVNTKLILDGLCAISLQVQEKMQSLDERAMLKKFCEGIIKLGETLVEIDDELQNVVLFIVNPFDAPSSVLDICVAFHALKKAYVNAFNSSSRVYPNNLVLQIVPMKNMASCDGLAVQSHNQSIRCAIEVYERCTQTIQDHHSQTFPQETYSPSIILARLPPKSIAFKVLADPSPAILQENMCLHVAYAQSIDERWVSAAWSDDCGEIKELANFCLGIPGTAILRPFDDVCKEIWAGTNKIISKKRVHWRIYVVKVGPIDDEEVELWTKLSDECAVPNSLTIFSSDPSPPFTFKYSLPSISPHIFNGQTQLVGTPGATPQSSGVSPDQFGASSQGGALTPGDTPGPEIDNDFALVDYTDETWGALLQHPLNNSDSTIKTKPALASGYLMKRTGPNETDEPVILAVSLIRAGHWSPGTSAQATIVLKSNEELLREVLTQYRGLVTLAQHLGVIDMVKEVMPWHIAAVLKCRDAFSCVL
ncbi:mediator of RNA polymerase II transcription subunit 13 [Orbilia ellipsospora]|uniref:Mediator of RNA polymerase II transcription subunit 13 n=1 Tax=Orbilia ellipsospora TaxID=2528407 RepID=A0AAV9XBC9_9PEZI